MKLSNRFALLPLLFAPCLAQAEICGSQASPAPLPVRSTPVPPIVEGLEGRPLGFAAPHALLGASRDESLALDLVLLRLRLESCTRDAYANYKPRTQFDNTPWRYNMEKGKKFSAAEFDAWMKSRGVRVAKGTAPAATSAAAPAVAATPAAVSTETAPATVKE
jgi:hypothetical protein